MSVDQSLVLEQCVGVSLTKTPRGLSAIKDPACSAAIWKRAPLQRFQTWIDGIDPTDLPRARIMLRPEVVREAMTDVSDAYRLPDSPERTMLIDDVAALAAMFSGIMDSRYLRLRLDVIETDACHKFHIDALTARLICTYRGHATQYGNGALGDVPEAIHEVPTGCPMILRGTHWPSTAAFGLVHRSPPIAGTGETRLVLVLDPISDIESEVAAGYMH
ncbi:MAG: DUF1826 domain-containing protein [Pseudomonadota bacterium]